MILWLVVSGVLIIVIVSVILIKILLLIIILVCFGFENCFSVLARACIFIVPLPLFCSFYLNDFSVFMYYVIFHTLFISYGVNLISNSNYQEIFCKKGVCKNFAKYTGKPRLYRSLFFNKVPGLQSAILLKQRLEYRCFPLNKSKLINASPSHKAPR